MAVDREGESERIAATGGGVKAPLNRRAAV